MAREPVKKKSKAKREPAQVTYKDKINSTEIKVKKKDIRAGRPQKYDVYVKPFLNDIYLWIKDGYTDYSICDKLGINQDTWTKYKSNISDVSGLYARATKERNNLVMNRMYSKASGMTGISVNEKLTKEGQIIALKSEIYVPPDVNAADLFLRNNDPTYKSAKSAEAIGSTTINFNVTELASKRAELLTELQKLSSIDVALIE